MTTLTETPAPAEVYDRMFVPALFARWGPVVADAAGVAPRRARCSTSAAAPAP